jgi:hypothetical protein
MKHAKQRATAKKRIRWQFNLLGRLIVAEMDRKHPELQLGFPFDAPRSLSYGPQRGG